MQRFKKELPLLFRDADQHGKRHQYWALRDMCTEHQKFRYGANGTLSQAARWREAGMRLMSRYPNALWVDTKRDLEHARRLLQSAREGGCRLPA